MWRYVGLAFTKSSNSVYVLDACLFGNAIILNFNSTIINAIDKVFLLDTIVQSTQN